MSEHKLQFLQRIKNGEKIGLYDWGNVTLTDLLLTDENNITYLEYACKNKAEFSFTIEKEITNNIQALNICVKNNYIYWMFSITNEDLFFQDTENGKNLLDYIFENKIDPGFSFISSFRKRIEIIDYVVKYKKELLYQLSPDIASLALTKQNGSYPIDKYINIPEVQNAIVRKASFDLLVAYCKEKNDYSILKNGSEKVLKFDIGNGKMVIEELLDKGIDPTFKGYDFTTQEILDVLMKRNRFDLLHKADLSILLFNYDENKTYLDLMIEKQKEGMNVHLEKMSYSYSMHPTEMTAMEIIKLAQNNMHVFIPAITMNMLLYKGSKDKKSVIECLVDIDKELTISKIIPSCKDRNNPNFVLVLRNLGIEDTNIKFPTMDKKFSDEYIKEYNKTYSEGCISICPELLEELKKLFYNDNKSDKSAIDNLIISYTYLTSTDNPNNKMFMLELKQLIEIKKQNPQNFIYEKIEDGAYFTKGEGICLDNDVISTINHETSHALHDYLADNIVPDNYLEIIQRVRNNDETIDRVAEYSKKFNELKQKIAKELSKSKIIEYYKALYQGEKLLELSFFLNSEKSEQKDKFKNDYQEQVLDTILAKTYSVDEFIKQRIEIEVLEMLDATLRNDYDALIAIGDIIDAIFMGKFKNGALLDKKGENIKPAYGHGIRYFDPRLEFGFMEMIANYGSIIKSKNAENIIKYLRSIVGDELVDMIKEVYENNILKSQVYIQDFETEEVKHAR